MLQNSATETLGFVQISSVKTTPLRGLFSSTVQAAYGYSIEVFRDKYYIGSISDTAEAERIQQRLKAIKAKNGDTLIWVSLIPHQITLNIPLTTNDKLNPICNLTLLLKVDAGRSREFANLFNQNNDVVKLAEGPITNALQRYASSRSYRTMDEDEMRHKIMQSLYGENKKYGMVVDSIPTITITPDEHIKRRTEMEKEADTISLQDHLTNQRIAGQNSFARQQDAAQNDHQRIEQAKDKSFARTQDLQDNLHQPIKEGLTNQLRQGFKSGRSVERILNEYPQMTDLYSFPQRQEHAGELPWSKRAELASGQPTNIHALGERAASLGQRHNEEQLAEGISQHTYTAFRLHDAGITLQSVRLSARQRELAGLQTLRAMLVIEVEEGDFAVGDLIATIDGVAMTDSNTLIAVLQAKHPAYLTVQLLRGEEVIETNITSIE